MLAHEDIASKLKNPCPNIEDRLITIRNKNNNLMEQIRRIEKKDHESLFRIEKHPPTVRDHRDTNNQHIPKQAKAKPKPDAKNMQQHPSTNMLTKRFTLNSNNIDPSTDRHSFADQQQNYQGLRNFPSNPVAPQSAPFKGTAKGQAEDEGVSLKTKIIKLPISSLVRLTNQQVLSRLHKS